MAKPGVGVAAVSEWKKTEFHFTKILSSKTNSLSGGTVFPVLNCLALRYLRAMKNQILNPNSVCVIERLFEEERLFFFVIMW